MVYSGTDKPSPEKQLLKLIEGDKTEEQMKGARRFGLGIFSSGAIGAGFSFLRDSLKGGFRPNSAFLLDLRYINRVLMVSVVVLLGYFVATLVNSTIAIKHIPDLQLNIRADPQSSLPDVNVLKNLAQYLDKTRARDMFNPYSEAVKDEPGKSEKQASSAILEATKDLTLVGIAWSNDPDAMIEDKTGSRTYFVKKGNMIGDLKVEAIYKDKVVLGYKGEEIDLK